MNSIHTCGLTEYNQNAQNESVNTLRADLGKMPHSNYFSTTVYCRDSDFQWNTCSVENQALCVVICVRTILRLTTDIHVHGYMCI